MTGGPAHNRKSSGPVVIRLRDDDMKYVAISDKNFEFVDPVIVGFVRSLGNKEYCVRRGISLVVLGAERGTEGRRN